MVRRSGHHAPRDHHGRHGHVYQPRRRQEHVAQGQARRRAEGGTHDPRHRGRLRRYRVWYGLPQGDAGPRHQRPRPRTEAQPGDHRHLQRRRHHLGGRRTLCRTRPHGRAQADQPRPQRGGTDGEDRGLHQQGGILRAHQRGHRAQALHTMVPQHAAFCRHRPRTGDGRRDRVLSQEV